MANEKPSHTALIVLVIVVIVAAGVAAGFVYELNARKATAPIHSVRLGDNVTVNYIGQFGTGPQTGRVFDTSLYSVATNNASYPKSLEYQSRGPRSAYTPLGVHVGPNAPSGGYAIGPLTFSSVVPGFWQGLIGLAGNQSFTIVIPPNLGYGTLNMSCVANVPLVRSVPILTSVPVVQFSSLYPNGTPTLGAVFPDPTYGWNDTVFAVNSTTVVVEALATVGTVATPNGLPFVVTGLTSTTLTVSSRLTPSDAGLVLGHTASGSGLCGKTTFIVNAVDLGAGTFSENFNPEVQGETLDFTVTVVDIFP